MKRWHVIFLMLVLVVAVFGCAEQTPEPAGTSIQEPASAPTELTTEIPTSPSGVHPIDLEGLECLVQVHTQAGSLSGSDRDPYTYYAIRESSVEQVDAEAVALIAPEMLDPVSSDYDNGETSRWFVELMYAPRVENYDSKGFSARNSSLSDKAPSKSEVPNEQFIFPVSGSSNKLFNVVWIVLFIS